MLRLLFFSVVLAASALPALAQASYSTALRMQAAASTDTTALAEAVLARRVADLEAQLVALQQAQAAAAAEAAQRDLERLDFSGQLFTRYGWNTTGTGAERHANVFALDRWYLTAQSELSERLRFRGTTDVVAAPEDARLGYTVIVKFAYFDWLLRPGVTLRAGIQQTGWQSYVTSVWGYRGVAKTMAHERGHLSPADLGATLTADLPDGLGEVALGVHNGRGFRSLEADRFKDVSARVVLHPFRHAPTALGAVQVGAHTYLGQHPDGRERRRWGALAAFERGAYTAAVNVEARRDGEVGGKGISVFGTLPLGRLASGGSFALLGLVDAYDPATGVADDRSLRTVAGVAYQPTPGLTLALDYQRIHARGAYARYDGVPVSADASVFLRGIVKY